MAHLWWRVTRLEPKLQESRGTLISLTPLSLAPSPVTSTVHAQCMFTVSPGPEHPHRLGLSSLLPSLPSVGEHQEGRVSS